MKGLPSFTIKAGKAEEAVLATFLSGAPHDRLAAELSFAHEKGNDLCPDGRINADAARVSYEGALSRPSATGSKLVVGVFDRGSGQLQLLEVGWHSALEQRVKLAPAGTEAGAEGSALAAGAATPGSGAPLRKRELVDEFGSKKARKKQRAEALRVVDAERMAERGSLEADLLEAGAKQAVLLQADAEAEALAAAAPSERPHLPRYVLGAADALESYPLDGLVPPAVWPELPHEALLAQAAAVRADAELASLPVFAAAAAPTVADPTSPPRGAEGTHIAHAVTAPFVQPRIGAIELGALRRARDEAGVAAAEPGAKARQVSEARALLFLRHLVAFQGLPPTIKPPYRKVGADGAAAGDEGAHHPLALKAGIPERAWGLILARFTEPFVGEDGKPANRRTEACADRLACHALALLLRLSRNALRVDAAAEALKLPKGKVTTCLRELGCTVGAACPAHAPAGTQVVGARYAELRLPLTFPAIKKKVQRSGR